LSKQPGNPQKNRLWREQGQECAYCKKKVRRKNATIDHIVPRARGGTNAVTNKVVTCRACNESKGDLLLSEWVENIYSVANMRLAQLGVA
jgi:5-methylcytosine-specific restriction endonuclease McrA